MNFSLFYQRFIQPLRGQGGEPPALCVIGISGDKAKALLVEWKEDSAQVTGAGEAPHPVHFGSDPPGRIVPVARACERAVELALEEARRSSPEYSLPQEAVVGLPIPLVRDELCKAAARRPNPEAPITDSEIIGLLNRLERLARRKVPSGGRLLDIGPLAFYIDGYESTDPRGLKGSKLEAKASVWLLDPRVWRAINALIERLDFEAITLTAIPRTFPFLTSESCWLLELGSKDHLLYLLDGSFTLGWALVSPRQLYQELEGALCHLAAKSGLPPFEFRMLGRGLSRPQLEDFLRNLRARRPELFPRPFNVLNLELRSPQELSGLETSPSEPADAYALALIRWLIQRRHPQPIQALAEKAWSF